MLHCPPAAQYARISFLSFQVLFFALCLLLHSSKAQENVLAASITVYEAPACRIVDTPRTNKYKQESLSLTDRIKSLYDLTPTSLAYTFFPIQKQCAFSEVFSSSVSAFVCVEHSNGPHLAWSTGAFKCKQTQGTQNGLLEASSRCPYRELVRACFVASVTAFYLRNRTFCVLLWVSPILSCSHTH